MTSSCTTTSPSESATSSASAQVVEVVRKELVEGKTAATAEEEEEETTPQEQRDDGAMMGSSTTAAMTQEEEDSDSDLELDFGQVMGASTGLPLQPPQEEQQDEEDDLSGFGPVMGASQGLPLEEEDEEDDNNSETDFGFVMGDAPLPVEEEVVVASSEEERQSEQKQSEEETPSVPGLAPSCDESPAQESVLSSISEAATIKQEDNPLATVDAALSATEEEDATNSNATTTEAAKPKAGNTLVDTVRKGAVAVAGGTLTAVGLVMIPLPTPCGALVAGSGMALLGTEFEAANRVMAQVQTAAEETRDQLINSVEAAIEDEGFPDEAEIVISKKQKETTTITTQSTTTAEAEDQDKETTTSSAQEAAATAATQSAASPPQQQQQQQAQAPKPAEEESSEFVIQVNADSYFDQEEQRIQKEREQGGYLNNYIYNPIEYARKRFGVEKKGFLATSVLPLLQKTKQFSSGGSGNAGKDNNSK